MGTAPRVTARGLGAVLGGCWQTCAMKFTTTLELSGRNTGVLVPPEVLEELGGGKQPLVNVVVNGYAYRSAVATMGSRSLIAFSSDKRKATGLQGGETIEVELTLDTEPRTVELPEELTAAFAAEPTVKAAFDALSPSKQKAHVTSIESAKAPETRARRVEAALNALRA